jgi:hypothetical protein
MILEPIENSRVGPPDSKTKALQFVRAMSDGQEALQNALLGDTSMVDAAVSNLEAETPPDFKADQLRRELVSLLKEAKQAPPAAATPGQKQKSAPDSKDKLNLDYKSWKAEYDRWIKLKSTEP